MDLIQIDLTQIDLTQMDLIQTDLIQMDLIHRGETIRVHHDTIRITIQSSRYNTYRDMLYTCTCTAKNEGTY